MLNSLRLLCVSISMNFEPLIENCGSGAAHNKDGSKFTYYYSTIYSFGITNDSYSER